MNEKEKRAFAEAALRRNGYNDEEVKRILLRVFGDKKKPKNRSNARQ